MPSLVVGTLRALLTLDSAKFEAGIRKSDKELSKFATSSRRLGRQASYLGSALTKGITLPLVALGATTSKAAIDFESSFAGVRKTVDATEEQFADLAQGFRDMSKEIPINVNELNRIGEAAGQLGIKTENILDFTETMAQLGVTTNLSADEAATALARLANITQMPQDQFDELGSTIVALGNNFATTEAEIVEFGLRIAGAGSQIGLTESEILAFGTALSSVGIKAEAGGTAISKVMVEIANAVASGGERLTKFAEIAGTTTADFRRQFETDAAGAVTTFIEGLGRLSDQGVNVFGVLEDVEFANIRVRDALLRASGAGDLLRDSLKVGAQALEDNTALTDEAAQRFETTRSQLTLLWNRIKDVGITIGNALLPMIRRAIEFFDDLLPLVERLAGAFGQLPVPLQAIAVGLAGIAATAGPLLLVVGQFAFGVSALATTFTAGGLAATAFAGLLAALSSPITAPIALLVGAGGLVFAVQRYIDTEEAVPRPVKDTTDAIEGQTGALQEAADAWDNLTTRERFSRVGDFFKTISVGLIEANDAWDRFRRYTLGFDFVKPDPLSQVARSVAQLAVDTPKLGGALMAAAPSAQALEETMARLNTSALAVAEVEIKAGKNGIIAGADWRTAAGDADTLTEELNALIRAERALLNDWPFHRQELDEVLQVFAKIKPEIADTVPLTMGFGEELVGLAGPPQVALANIDNVLGQIGTKLEDEVPPTFFDSLGAQLSLTFKRISAELPDVIIGALQGGGSVGKAIGAFIGGGIGSDLGALATKAIGGKLGSLVGGLLGPLGAIGGQFLGSLFSKIGGGPSAAELAARDQVQTFTETIKDGLSSTQMAEAQQALADGWANVNDAALVIGVRDMFVEAGRSAAEGEQAVARLWAAMKNGSQDAVKAAQDAILEVTGEFTSLADMQAANFDEMRQAAQRYGIDLESLGDSFLQAELDKTAQQIKRDFDLLIAGGADVKGVLEGMSDEISDLVQDSLKFGTEIPANMRPLVEQLIESGQLIDENGEKLTSLEGLNFAETLAASIGSLNDTLRDLVDHLTGQGGVLDAFSKFPSQINIPVNFQTAGLPAGIQLPQFHVGTPNLDFSRFGRESIVATHGSEAIIPQGSGHLLAGEIARAMPVGGGGAVVVNNDFRGALIPGDFDAEQRLSRIISQAIASDAELSRRLGVA